MAQREKLFHLENRESECDVLYAALTSTAAGTDLKSVGRVKPMGIDTSVRRHKSSTFLLTVARRAPKGARFCYLTNFNICGIIYSQYKIKERLL